MIFFIHLYFSNLSAAYMSKNIVNQYFKKQIGDILLLVQVNPVIFKGLELIIKDGEVQEKNKMVFDEDIFEDLEVDKFKAASPLEFNIYLKNLQKK